MYISYGHMTVTQREGIQDWSSASHQAETQRTAFSTSNSGDALTSCSGMESFVLNEEMFANTGAGIFAFQLLEEKGAQAIIVRNIGQASLNLLKDAKISVYQGTEATLAENLSAFMAGKLEKIA